jgi:hypothetical protein
MDIDLNILRDPNIPGYVFMTEEDFSKIMLILGTISNNVNINMVSEED